MSLKVILTLEKVPQAATKDLHDRLHMYKCVKLAKIDILKLLKLPTKIPQKQIISSSFPVKFRFSTF